MSFSSVLLKCLVEMLNELITRGRNMAVLCDSNKLGLAGTTPFVCKARACSSTAATLGNSLKGSMLISNMI